MPREGFRLAVVGETALETQEIMARLESGALPPMQVVRMGPEEDPRKVWDAVGADPDDRREILLPLDVEGLSSCDFVILGRVGEAVKRRILAGAGGGTSWILDTVPDGDGPWTDPDGSARDFLLAGRHLRLPDPGAVICARLGKALDRFDPRAFIVHRFLPASHLDQPGILELHAQASALLSFQPFPTEVLGGQVAFNLLPEDPAEHGRAFAGQVAALWAGCPAFHSSAFWSSSFHGAALSVWAHLNQERDLETLKVPDSLRVLPGARFEGPPSSPADAASAGEMHLRIAPQEGGWIWIWAVYDNVRAGRADQVVRILRTLVG